MFFGEVAAADFDALADALGDSPFTVITTHLLRRRWCHAWLAGDLPRYEAILIRHKDGLDQPNGFGANEHALWELLCNCGPWEHVTVEVDVAPRLAALMKRKLNQPYLLLADVYYTLEQPAPLISHPHVRVLTAADTALIIDYAPHMDMAELGWRLQTGAVAGAILGGKIVADCQPYGLSTKYCEIGVDTLEPYRNQGYSTACTTLTCQQLQQQGIVPVWGAREDNPASLRVADKIGFNRIGQVTHLIPAH